jgi:hypothetical protein
MLSYDELISQASETLQKAGIAAKEQADFLVSLKKIGGTTVEALASCSWEDLEQCGAPRLTAKQISMQFRQKTARPDVALSPTRVSMMKPTALLECYDPSIDDAVAQALNKKSGGKPFLVFRDGKIDVRESTIQLENLMAGLPSQPFVMVGSVPHQTYCVGQAPERIFDENPLMPGQPLRLNGTCPYTEFDWSGNSLEVRQMVRLAITSMKTDKDAIISILLNTIYSDQGKLFAGLSKRWPKAALQFMELKQTGNLPSLKMVPKSRTHPSNDPFHGKA